MLKHEMTAVKFEPGARIFGMIFFFFSIFILFHFFVNHITLMFLICFMICIQCFFSVFLHWTWWERKLLLLFYSSCVLHEYSFESGIFEMLLKICFFTNNTFLKSWKRNKFFIARFKKMIVTTKVKIPFTLEAAEWWGED